MEYLKDIKTGIIYIYESVDEANAFTEDFVRPYDLVWVEELRGF